MKTNSSELVANVTLPLNLCTNSLGGKNTSVAFRCRDTCCRHLKLSPETAWKNKKMTHAGTAAGLLSMFRFLRRWERRGRRAHSQVGSCRSRQCPTQTPSPPGERWLPAGAWDTSPLQEKVKNTVFMTFYLTVISHFWILAGWQLCNNILPK